MDLSAALSADLRALTHGLDQPELTLEARVHELVANLRRGVSSYRGLTVTIVDNGRSFTMTVMDDGAKPEDIASSAALPLTAVDGAEPGSRIVFYAGNAGGLVDLAADLSYALRLPLGTIELDRDLLAPSPDGGLAGLAESMRFNQAIGILIDRGYTAKGTRAELQRLAQQAGITVDRQAQQLIHEVTD